MAFQRATRKKSWMKLAITGPSGGGKTFSALRLAFGLGSRVALIDTENGSGSLYAHLGEYDALEIGPPFTVQKYVEAIREAVAGGYDVLIIDSLTHAWAGEGGLLSQKEALDARGGNSYTNWASITKQHEAFKAAILQAPIHVVVTMRSKMDYVVEKDPRGKSAPQKLGLAPVQREGMEYEFTTVFDVAMDHSAVTSKDRTGLFDGMNGLITEEHGRRIAAWLASGADPLPDPAQVSTAEPAHAPESRGDARAAQAVERAEQPNTAVAGGNAAEVGNLRAECKRLADSLGINPDEKGAVRQAFCLAYGGELPLFAEMTADHWRAVRDGLQARLQARPGSLPLDGAPAGDPGRHAR